MLAAVTANPPTASPGRYRELAGTIRKLVPTMKYADTRGELQGLAANYERLAQFADASQRAAQAEERHAVWRSFATERRRMQALSEQFGETLAHALRIRAQFIRTELELGLTFVATALAREPKSSQRYMRNAIAALMTVNRLLALEPRIDDSDIHRRRDELRESLRKLLG